MRILYDMWFIDACLKNKFSSVQQILQLPFYSLHDNDQELNTLFLFLFKHKFYQVLHVIFHNSSPIIKKRILSCSHVLKQYTGGDWTHPWSNLIIHQ